MNHYASQELLPPVSERPNASAGWLDWLFDPSPPRFLLPATGLWILGLDWLLFAKEAATLGFALPATSLIGFLAGSVGGYYFQRRYALNSRGASLLKGLLAGILVGVPFPLAGTLVGGWVLATSGLAGWQGRLLSKSSFRQ